MDNTNKWRAFSPPAQWPTGYQAQWLGRDLLARLTLAAYAMLVSLTLAARAGLPSQTGLNCYRLGDWRNALGGSARYLTSGPTSAVALGGRAHGEAAKSVNQPATGKYASLFNAFHGSDASPLATVPKVVAALQGGK